MAIMIQEIIEELRGEGLIPKNVPIHIGSLYSMVVGPAAVVPPFNEHLGVDPGVHLPKMLFLGLKPRPGMRPDWQALLQKTQEELDILRSLLIGAGLPADNIALARFIVLHEVGHWVQYVQEGTAPFLADMEARQRIQGNGTPWEYRQLPTEAWADVYALAQLKVFYARRPEEQQPSEEQKPQPRSFLERLVSLLRRA